MQENYESIKERMRKIKRLMESATGGEREAAAARLNEMLRKYNLTLEGLQEDTKHWYGFRVMGEAKQILTQCYCYLMNETSMPVGQVNGEHLLYLKLTPYVYAELRSLYEWHWEHYQQERKKILKDLMAAYTGKHGLHSQKGVEQAEPLSREEYMRLCSLMGILSNEKRTKMLEKL